MTGGAESDMAKDLAGDIGRRAILLGGSTQISAGPLGDAISRHRKALEHSGFVAGLWAKRPELWSSQPEVQRRIKNRLGWLESPERMAASLPRLTRFADAMLREGVRHVVLLGMGGSSLAAEVIRAILAMVEAGSQFTTLDTTDPTAIREVEERIPIQDTLFVVSSKSGTTIEPNLLSAYFASRLKAAGVRDPGRHFIAITDEGTPLYDLAVRERYHDIFLNAADIGGRYSALSFFGLVPAALMGIDVAGLLAWGRAMAVTCVRAASEAGDNPGVMLGIVMGAAALSGRDKLTLIAGDRLMPLGLWIEQLVAESTGKEGKGIVPIAGEPVGPPRVYGDDRLFVRLRLSGGDPEEQRIDGQTASLEAAGFPIVTIDLEEPAAIGAEFVRWEIATATAGAILGVNPFDEPDVQRSKDATQALLEKVVTEGRLPVPAAQVTIDDLSLTLGKPVLERIDPHGKTAQAMCDDFVKLLGKGDYVGILAYLPFDAPIGERLTRLRASLRDRARVATMFSYGPRYLHSVGQLHKGGPNTGVLVFFTADPEVDVGIPGRPYTFGTLELAQALGNFVSLEAAGRRAIRFHLRAPDLKHVDRACALLEHALSTT